MNKECGYTKFLGSFMQEQKNRQSMNYKFELKGELKERVIKGRKRIMRYVK